MAMEKQQPQLCCTEVHASLLNPDILTIVFLGFLPSSISSYDFRGMKMRTTTARVMAMIELIPEAEARDAQMDQAPSQRN